MKFQSLSVESRLDQTNSLNRTILVQSKATNPFVHDPNRWIIHGTRANEIYAIPKIETTKFLVMRIDYGLHPDLLSAKSRKNATRSLFVAKEFSPRWKVKACGLRLRKVFPSFFALFRLSRSNVFSMISLSLSLSWETCGEKLIEWKRGKRTKIASLKGCWSLIGFFFFFSFSFARERIVGLREFMIIG